VDYLVKPINRAALIAALERSTAQPGRSRPRLLAVDDDPSTLEFLTAALRPEGFEVVTTTSPFEALELARGGGFDVIVCDLLMPELDGWEVVQALKADAGTASIPVLLCTAHELSDADRIRLNGHVLGIVSKGADAREGLRRMLSPVSADLGARAVA
jgi:CheY-like chemotaxis protein